MATIVITGGTGLIGQALVSALLKKQHQVIVLTREPSGKKATPGVTYARWNIAAQTLDKRAIAQADAIIHLAGASVAGGRWTAARKQEIVASRVQSSAVLVKALRENANQVKTVVSASAIGWYGSDPNLPNPTPFVETDGAASDFLGTTCVQWEQSIEPVTNLGKRLVVLRMGIVLSNSGGAYAEFKKPLRFGVATILGNGNQIVSWIHIDDIVNLYLSAIERQTWQGVYNAVAPQPVSNETLIKTMANERSRLHLTTHVPAVALKAALGEMSTEVLKSATVSSRKIEAAGYRFLHPDIKTAVHNLHKNAS